MRHALEPPSGPERARKPYAACVPQNDADGMLLGYWYATEDGQHGEIDTPAELAALIRARTHRGRSRVWWFHDADHDLIHLARTLQYDPGWRVELRTTNAGSTVGLKLHDDHKHAAEVRSARQLLDLDRAPFCEAVAPGSTLLDNPASSLLIALVSLDRRVFGAFGVHLRGSAAATAMAAWKRTLPAGTRFWRANRQCQEFVRRAYHGGVLWSMDDESHADQVSVDRVGAYAACMREGVPYGRPVYTESYEFGRPGYYRCTLDRVPDAERVGLFRWGLDEGEVYCSSLELEEARRRGYRLGVVDGYTFDGLAYPFARVLDLCETMETKGGIDKQVAKLIRCSLYGKFGARDTIRRYVLAEQEPPPDEDGGWAPVWDDRRADFSVIPNLWQRDVAFEASYQLPEWAAWITARQRVEVTRFAEAVEATAVNVDEITLPSGHVSRVPLGTGYGTFKRKEEWAWVIHPRPGWRVGETTDGRTEAITPGVPSEGYTVEQILAGIDGERAVAEWESRTGFLARLKGERRLSTTRRADLRAPDDPRRALDQLPKGEEVSLLTGT